jgi:flagellar hook-associated protein 2
MRDKQMSGISASNASSSSNGQLGAGIDVSSTVAALMQVRELPEQQLQTQQTQLKSQAQAIDSINGNLTSLQTAVQALTNFIGPLDALTATSSNTNLLMASAATGATAGQYQVVINNLAQTASVFSSVVNSSAPITAGSFTLQGSSGTIPISTTAGETIGQLQQAINAANVGVTASVVTDSTGSRISFLSSTSGAAGNITVSGNTSGLTFTSLYSSAVASSSSPIATGTFTIQAGSGTASPVTIDSTDNTLAGVAQAINQANAGVSASIVTDSTGSRLSLLSSTGTTGDVTVSGNTTGLTFTSLAGADASLTVGGIPIDSSTNTVQNAIPGVTLNLVGANANSTVNLAVAPDATQASSAIQSFVSAYNTAIQSVNAQFSFNAATDTSAPPLLGDSTLSSVQQQMYSAITYSTNGQSGINSLADLGISVNQDGTLSVNSSQLTTALSSNNAAAVNFLQSPTTGFAEQLGSLMQNLTDPIKGSLNVELNGVNATVTSLQSQITAFQTQMTTVQQQLTAEFDSVNTTLQQLPLLLQQINSQLGSVG